MTEGMDSAVQLVGSLFLFALVVGLAYVTSRFIGGRLGSAGGGRRLMRVVEAAPLGRDRQLVLMEVAGSYFLVGSGPQGVSQLTPVTDPAALARIEQAATPPPGPPAAGEPGAPVHRLLALLRRPAAPLAAPFSAVLAAARRRPAPQGAAGPGADPGIGPETRTASGSGAGPGGESEHPLPEHPLEATIGRLRQLAREPKA